MKNSLLKTNQKIDGILKEKDSVLGILIDKIGPVEVKLKGNYFNALAHSIVGQQLSNKATNTIWSRVEKLLEEDINPEKLVKIDSELLREVGVSYSKIQYLKNLAQFFIDNNIQDECFENMGVNQVIETLTVVKGIGVWTSEMFLIFSLGYEDVFSVSDVGLQRAIKWLYSLDEKPSKEKMNQIGLRWKPYRTYASLYLWEAINRNIILDDIEELYNGK